MTETITPHRHLWQNDRRAAPPGLIPEVCADCGQRRQTPRPPLFNNGRLPEPLDQRQRQPIPAAEVLSVHGQSVIIACPLCGRRHRHSVKRHGRQHFAAGCGITQSPDVRARGYTFTTHDYRA